MTTTTSDVPLGLDFIRQAVSVDVRSVRYSRRICTRFPPEPNGYLHIGHAKSMCLNFGVAAEFAGVCNLRFDDTNPETEQVEYVNAIKTDVDWLGFNCGDREVYASDYFEDLYQYAVQLIKEGKAYVDSLRVDEISAYRGRWDEAGRASPDRNRPIDQNLDLFARMRAGEFEEGTFTLRAKIDMMSSNMNMRDPTVYRIRRVPHYRRGKDWCIYPMYDFTHCLSDSIEGVTHSLCTMEFEDHRPLYEWYLDNLNVSSPPRQIEFARLNLSYTVLSKRKLLELVAGGYVRGWDDPRMPTLGGLRRRGYTPEAIREFCDRIGVAKANSVVDIALLEDSLRQDLNKHARRVMAVLRPLRVVIENYPVDQVEKLDAVNNPEDPSMGSRKILFSRIIYIEQEDFLEDPPKKYFRLSPGREVRLRYAYLIKCVGVVKDPETGCINELRCTYDPETRGGYAPDGRKVRGTIHWVSAPHSIGAEVRLYSHLFKVESPEDVSDGLDYKENLSTTSLETLTNCALESSMASSEAGQRYQFERQGYFCVDLDSSDGRPVFNRTVSLRDTWAKIERARLKNN